MRLQWKRAFPTQLGILPLVVRFTLRLNSFSAGALIFWSAGLSGSQSGGEHRLRGNVWGADRHGLGRRRLRADVFFLAPKACRQSLCIRVFYPDCSGQLDEVKFGWNTTTDFSLYGGAGCYSGPDARRTEPVGDYRFGILLE